MISPAPNRRIGILGGTFDPIHVGHVDLAEAAERTLELQRIYVIPANVPPHRPQPFASTFHRFAMVALTVSGRPSWRASDLELRSPAPSYTTTTLQRFHERGYQPSELFFLIGADAFLDIASWKDYPDILDAAHFVVVSRPGCSVAELRQRLPSIATRMVEPGSGRMSSAQPWVVLIHATTADVSSTAIRQRRTEGQPITGMVDVGVQQYIEQHGLYSAMIPGRRGNDRPPETAAGRLHGQG
jgi:nicotinate-nucleotide adenylyltransferase